MLFKIFLHPKPAPSTAAPDTNGSLFRRYREQVEQKHIRHDDGQYKVLEHCQNLLDALMGHNRQSAAYRMLGKRPGKIRSLYLYGGVGRGKSMLMDWLFEACPFAEKRRVHFHSFMQEVHAWLHQCRQEKRIDGIESFANKIRQSARLLCFDEFHVTDIADAMILGRLFAQFFEHGIVTVFTSNRHPNELYQGGLQREQFLFFIKLLYEHADVIELAAKEDFRLSHFKSLKTTYYHPLGPEADQFIHHSYLELTNYAELKPSSLSVLGRTVTLTAAHGDVALSSFEELCAKPLAAADYLAVADEFSTLILSGIPKLSAFNRNEAKRFVTLIDTLYQHKVKLICSAEVFATELYPDGDGAFEFARTVSRLIEMQSEYYWGSEHN